MKSTILNLKKRVLVVEMPRISNYQVNEHYLRVQLENGDSELIYGKYDLICVGSELSEEILIPFLDYFVHEDDAIVENQTFNANVYKDYRDNGYLDNALDSFISAIEANGYYWSKNPIEKPNEKFTLDGINIGVDVDAMEDWHEAESLTFNPEQCLIFEIL